MSVYTRTDKRKGPWDLPPAAPLVGREAFKLAWDVVDWDGPALRLAPADTKGGEALRSRSGTRLTFKCYLKRGGLRVHALTSPPLESGGQGGGGGRLTIDAVPSIEVPGSETAIEALVIRRRKQQCSTTLF
jgi:hypothetical protein